MPSLCPDRRFAHLPWCTWGLASVAVAVFFTPSATGWLAYEKDAVGLGEVWRFATGHLTHWSFEHLFWDVLAFIVPGMIVESRSHMRLIIGILGSAAAISGEVWLIETSLTSYRDCPASTQPCSSWPRA